MNTISSSIPLILGIIAGLLFLILIIGALVITIRIRRRIRKYKDDRKGSLNEQSKIRGCSKNDCDIKYLKEEKTVLNTDYKFGEVHVTAEQIEKEMTKLILNLSSQ